MSIWALTAYYNPRCFRSRLCNYRWFRRHLQLPLLTIEWSVDGTFQLGDHEAEKLVRLVGGDLMWQKERLLSIAVSRLPPDCEAVVLMDADILIPDSTWLERLSRELDRVPLVQPFREVRHLPPLPAGDLDAPERWLQENKPFYLARQSFADRCRHGVRSTKPPTAALDRGLAYQQELRRLATRPSFGHAWALRRDWLEELGLYEHNVAGSGDLAFAMAIAGRSEEFCDSYPLNEAQKTHYLRWAVVAAAAGGPNRINSLDTVAFHLFHGHLKRRNYRARLEVLASSGFDPAMDLMAEEGHPFRWVPASRRATGLRQFFATYFQNRAEDEGLQPAASGVQSFESDALERLLIRAGLDPESCSQDDSWLRPRGKTRLQLKGPGGTRLKVRSFLTPDAVAAMVRVRQWLGDHPGFSRLLAWSSTLVLEEWVEGECLQAAHASPAQARAAGALLAELHRIPMPQGQPAEAPVHFQLEQGLIRLQELADTGALPPARARRLAQELQARAPRLSRQGLVHSDFCGENLVWSETRGVVSIDNEGLRLGPLASDLGRSVVRWPLPAEAREAFFSGYAFRGGPAETDQHSFWLLLAHVKTAWFRARHDPATAAAPLQALKEWQAPREESRG